MPVDFEWDDPGKTILRFRATERWDWNEFHKHLRRCTLRIDESDHPVDLIFDLRGTERMPAGSVGHLRSLGKSIHAQHPPRAVVIGVDDDLQAQLGVSAGALRGVDRLLRFAADDSEAYAIIADWRDRLPAE